MAFTQDSSSTRIAKVVESSLSSQDLERGASSNADVAAKLPPSVGGSMDGEKPPMTLLEDVKQNLDQQLEPLQRKYGHYLTKLRPWREFARLSRPQGDQVQRLNVNLSHYQINYALIFLALMATSIVMNPKCLLAIAVLVVVWMAFLRKNDDPAWEVQLAGVLLGKTQRWLILCGITSILLLCVVGRILFSAAFCCALLVLAHAVSHPPAQVDEAGDTNEKFMTDMI